jgi:hypothetical protein
LNALSKSSKALRISDIDKWSEIVTPNETPAPATPYVPIFSKTMPSKPSDLFLIANLKSDLAAAQEKMLFVLSKYDVVSKQYEKLLSEKLKRDNEDDLEYDLSRKNKKSIKEKNKEMIEKNRRELLQAGLEENLKRKGLY